MEEERKKERKSGSYERGFTHEKNMRLNLEMLSFLIIKRAAYSAVTSPGSKSSSASHLNSMLLVSDAILLVCCFADIFQHCNHLHLSTISEKVRA
jgi:hypothetical protein